MGLGFRKEMWGGDKHWRVIDKDTIFNGVDLNITSRKCDA